MTSCISPVYNSIVPKSLVSQPHISRRGLNSLLPMPLILDSVLPISHRPFTSGSVPSVPIVPHVPASILPAHPISRAFTTPVIPPMIYQHLQPAQDQQVLQTPDYSIPYMHNFTPAQPPINPAPPPTSSVKRTFHLDGSDDEASALKKFLAFQYPRKSKKVALQSSWSTNPSLPLSSKNHLSTLSDNLVLFAKTLSGNDKGICRQILMEGLAGVLDEGISQTNKTNKDIVGSIQKFIVAGNKKGGNIPTQALQAREAVISACKFSVKNNLEKVRTTIGVSKHIFIKIENNGIECTDAYKRIVKNK